MTFINTNMDYLLELSLIRALPELLIDKPKPKSRTASLINRIVKYSEREIKRVPATLSSMELMLSLDYLDNFFISVQWKESKKLNDIMMISFLLGLIDQSSFEYPDLLISALNDSYEWLQDQYKDPDEYLEEADRALKMWKGRIDERAV